MIEEMSEGEERYKLEKITKQKHKVKKYKLYIKSNTIFNAKIKKGTSEKILFNFI